MEKRFNYQYMFEQALRRIKAIRDPHATRRETSDLRWNDVANQVIFDFVDSDLRKYNNVATSANKISISCLCSIIVQLLEKYKYPIQQLSIDDEQMKPRVKLWILEKKTNTLLIFSEIEECPIWKLKEKEPENIQKIMDNYGITACKYIYLVYDNAYLQVIGHNDDQDDPGRGYNIYSLKWFFEEYFGTEEYNYFVDALRAYLQEATNCIGYISVKTLTPGSLINFRKVTENELLKYQYEKLLSICINNFSLESSEFIKLRDQFFVEKTFQGLLGNNDYAESLITAEWLFDSMKRAKAIDLTIIGMGYFKAVEQLLYELICLHKNEGRQIKKHPSKHALPPTVELNDKNIKAKAIDSTMGSMAVFFRDNFDIFRDDLDESTKEYVKEIIFKYTHLRNNYFHKENIHSWRVIESIRNATFELLFLLLGAKSITEQNKNTLGFPLEIQSEYYKLCEYVHYHHGGLFFLEVEEGYIKMAFGYNDAFSKVLNDKYVGYTGVYFKELSEEGSIIRFSEDNLPARIMIGKFVYGYSDEITIEPKIIQTVFENGKFVGPSIAEEEKLDY